MLSITILVLCVVSLSFANFVSLYDREITIIKDRKDVGSVEPNAFIDYDHERARDLGYLSATDIADITSQAYSNINLYYGINVSAGTPLGGGLFEGPYWIFFPFEVGTDDYMYLLSFDSENLPRGILGGWFVDEIGGLLAFTQSGNFTGGINQGYSYVADDVVIYNNVAMLKSNSSWTFKKNIEQHRCFTKVPGKPVVNTFGLSDSVIRFDCTDLNLLNPSVYLVTNVYRPGPNKTVDELKRAVWTWSKST
jgi:hypothetical protein